MRDLPGYLETTDVDSWLTLVYNSDHEPNVKLAATILSRTAIKRKHSGHWLFLTNCSPYTVSRILRCSIDEAKQYLSELENNGWLWHVRDEGARRVYILCFNLKPGRIRK